MSENISPDVIKKTQKVLGKYVKKPPLTEKLLKKPPFRFLHDIIINVVKDTGFLKGLFSEEELNSENVKEKDAKISFLNKLIEAVKITTNTDLPVKASKVVAGLEPTNTNLLLQTIGKAIDSKVDTSEYTLQLNSGQPVSTEKKRDKKTSQPIKKEKDDKAKTSVRSKVSSKDEKLEKPPAKLKSRKPSLETPKSKTPKESSRKTKEDGKSKGKHESKSKIKEVPEKIERIEKKVYNPNDIVLADENVKGQVETNAVINNDNITEASDTLLTAAITDKIVESLTSELKIETTEKTDDSERVQHKVDVEKEESRIQPHLVRPKSARPKSSDRIVLPKPKVENESLKPLEMTTHPSSQRPKSSLLRPPSVRPSSARPGAPRLRPDSSIPLQEAVQMGNINVIVENTDHADDEETVVIQSAGDEEQEKEEIGSIELPMDNKGHLVEQILEQIQEDGHGNRKKVDIDWEQDALHNKEGAAKELTQLRLLIQTVTKTANPLGNLMNYLHEDFDAMHAELQMWTETKKQLFSEIYKKKRLSAESTKPLLSHLEQLQEEIKKQEQEIDNVSCNIIKNDVRIKELISK